MSSIPLEWIAATLGGAITRSDSHEGIALSVDQESLGIQAHLILQSTAAGVLAQPAISTYYGFPPTTFRLGNGETGYGSLDWVLREGNREEHFTASEDVLRDRELPVLINELSEQDMNRIARLQKFAALVAGDIRTSKRRFWNAVSSSHKSGFPASLSIRGSIPSRPGSLTKT